MEPMAGNSWGKIRAKPRTTLGDGVPPPHPPIDRPPSTCSCSPGLFFVFSPAYERETRGNDAAYFIGRGVWNDRGLSARAGHCFEWICPPSGACEDRPLAWKREADGALIFVMATRAEGHPNLTQWLASWFRFSPGEGGRAPPHSVAFVQRGRRSSTFGTAKPVIPPRFHGGPGRGPPPPPGGAPPPRSFPSAKTSARSGFFFFFCFSTQFASTRLDLISGLDL